MLPVAEKHIGEEWDKLYTIHNFSNITGKGIMGGFELENKWSDNCINRCSSSVPFDKISSGEESNFIFHNKIIKEPTIHY